MRWMPAVLLALALAGCSGDGPRGAREGTASESPTTTASPSTTSPPRPPLAGRTVVIDPGHQLGNAAHPAQVNAPVSGGGLTKPCNSTGTATDAGYPEATFNWAVATLLRRRLERLGAEVVLTRSSNSVAEWGPCVDDRGRAAARGDLLVSIHADGSFAPGAHGFHVIWAPTVRGSQALARDLRAGLLAAGLAPATYAGEAGLDSRSDLLTLNLAERPAVLVELGNMRDPGDAARMSSPAGRQRYVDGLVRGLRRHLR